MVKWGSENSVRMVLLVACAASVVVGGCEAAPDRGVGRAQLAEKRITTSCSDPVTTMPIEERRSLIASDFPAEIPVPKGILERGRSQQEAWDYVIAVDASPDALAAWYRENLELRSWMTVTARIDEATDERILEMRKVAAETRIVIGTDQSTGMARAQVVVGIGAPILETR